MKRLQRIFFNPAYEDLGFYSLRYIWVLLISLIIMVPLLYLLGLGVLEFLGDIGSGGS